VSLLLQTALIAWLVLLRPLQSRTAIRTLSADLGPRAQIGFYQRFLRRWWATTAVVAGLLLLDGAPFGLGWPTAPEAVALVGAVAFGLALSVALVALVPPFRRFFLWQVSKLGAAPAVFPRSPRAAAWFAAVALTAGFCEEFAFRGLVPWWASRVAGLFGGWDAAPFVASAVGFGVAHLYQGWRGMVLTGLLGGWLYLVTAETGSLLPAMAMHALVDLRIAALFFVLGPIPATRR
jgi:hypothetical protein